MVPFFGGSVTQSTSESATNPLLETFTGNNKYHIDKKERTPLFNPQKNMYHRQTKTKLKFNKFNYVSDWLFGKKETIFEENILFNDNSKHIKNKHTLYIRNIGYYKKIEKKKGFILVKIIDLTPVNHDNNYIYIFQKKYGE
jgi:hypothetical protein